MAVRHASPVGAMTRRVGEECARALQRIFLLLYWFSLTLSHLVLLKACVTHEFKTISVRRRCIALSNEANRR